MTFKETNSLNKKAFDSELAPNLRETTRLNLQNQNTKENNTFVTHFKNLRESERFTYSDTFKMLSLVFLFVTLTTYLSTSLQTNVEANLLGVLTPSTTIFPPKLVINPLQSQDFQLFNSTIEKEEDANVSDDDLNDSIVRFYAKIESIQKSKTKVLRKKEQAKIAFSVEGKAKSSQKVELLSSSVQREALKKEEKATKNQGKAKAKVPKKIDEQPMASAWKSTQKRAKKEGKNYFVLFGASYCMPCRMMKNVMQDHHNVKEYLQANYLYQYVDIQLGEGKLMQLEYNVQTLPTLVMFNEFGQQIGKYEGGLSSVQLMDILESHQNNFTAAPTKTIKQDLPQLKKEIAVVPQVKAKEERKEQLNTIISEITNEYIREGREK